MRSRYGRRAFRASPIRCVGERIKATGVPEFREVAWRACLSQAMTLEPGDVISTGTPSGVGVKMKPRGYMRAGQVVKIEIEKIGSLSNPVIHEPDGFIACHNSA